MDKILNINTVEEYDAYWGLPHRHPYVKYPQYLSCAFKKLVGCSPNEYRLAR